MHQIIPKAAQLQLSKDAIYLLVGCLGGLGRSLTRWMKERGAKHFAFISRSGADKPEAARLVESLQRSGATTEIFHTDASDEEAVCRVVSQLEVKFRIRGVVHAATVFKVRELSCSSAFFRMIRLICEQIGWYV